MDPLKTAKYSEASIANAYYTPTSIALHLAGQTQLSCTARTRRGNGASHPPWEKSESFQRETSNLQFKCIGDQAVPPHMQIDANDMQMAQSKPGFANVLCQAASYEVQPGLVCARSSHLGPRDLGVNVQLHLLQEAVQGAPPPSGLALPPDHGLLRAGAPSCSHCTPSTGTQPGTNAALRGCGLSAGREAGWAVRSFPSPGPAKRLSLPRGL